jgi:hypothetical protein
VVDVGHSEKSYGARSARGASEYEFNLRLATQIVQALLDQGFANTTLLITTDPKRTGLLQRAERANKMAADLFLSIHHDSVPKQFMEKWEYEGAKHIFSDRFPGHSIFISNDNADRAGSFLFGQLIGRELKTRGLQYTRRTMSSPSWATGGASSWTQTRRLSLRPARGAADDAHAGRPARGRLDHQPRRGIEDARSGAPRADHGLRSPTRSRASARAVKGEHDRGAGAKAGHGCRADVKDKRGCCTATARQAGRVEGGETSLVPWPRHHVERRRRARAHLVDRAFERRQHGVGGLNLLAVAAAALHHLLEIR